MWEGALGSEKVCIKVLRMYTVNTNNQKGPLAVCDIHEFLVCPIIADSVQAFLRRSRRLEETEASKRCTFLGCHNDAVADRIKVDA